MINKKIVTKIFTALSEEFPNPTTDLIYKNNLELLISVILSARTTDKTVNKITKKLFSVANTPEKIIALGIKKLKTIIKSSGFFNTKAQNIIATCKILVKDFNSKIPKTREDLEALPGVGRKTANVVLNVAFNEPTIAVDTHVFRIANRIGLANGKTPTEVETQLLKVVPKKFAKTASNLFILHGRRICIAQKPKCDICSISTMCKYHTKSES